MTDEDAGLIALKEKIRVERGFNCHSYKDKCLRRRFGVRMRARGIDDFGGYSDLLDGDPVEYDRLIDTLTVNVTKFFRNQETWEVMARELVPHLLARDRREVSVWSAGCATGEEAYSLSILLHECALATGRETDLDHVRIIGTDVDRGSLATARRAEYAEFSFTETPPDVRNRWFSPSPPFRPHESVRGRVEFRELDLVSGEPLRRQSMILCRNVLIYFDRSVQEHLFQTFHESLVPGGFLVLGRAETLVGPTRAMFKPISTRERVYVSIA